MKTLLLVLALAFATPALAAEDEQCARVADHVVEISSVKAWQVKHINELADSLAIKDGCDYVRNVHVPFLRSAIAQLEVFAALPDICYKPLLDVGIFNYNKTLSESQKLLAKCIDMGF